MTVRVAQISQAVVSPIVLALAACSGGSGSPPATYTVGGSVSGLSVSGLVLGDDAATDLTINTNGPFTFGASVPRGTAYDVVVRKQPLGFTEVCSVNNGVGTVGESKVIDVAVVCHPAIAGVSLLAGSPFGAGYIASTALDASGNLYAATPTQNEILKVTPDGQCSVLAGSATTGNVDGNGGAARLNHPGGVAADAGGNVYVADTGNNEIRKITPAGEVTTLAGNPTPGNTNGTGQAASFNAPTGVAVDSAGNVYVADAGNDEVRKVTQAGAVTTLASGVSAKAIAVDSAGNVYAGAVIITPAGAIVPPAHPYYQFTPPYCDPAAPECNTESAQLTAVTVDSAGNVYAALAVTSCFAGSCLLSEQFWISTPTGSLTHLTDAQSPYPIDTLSVDTSGTIYATSAGKILAISPGGAVTWRDIPPGTGSADGMGSAASFARPQGLAVDASGNVYVADTGNEEIRRINSAGVVTTLAGSTTAGSADGTGDAASFDGPEGIAVDAAGNLYVADSFNNELRKITPAGKVTTLAGSTSDSAPTFYQPLDVAVDAAGNVYVTNSFYNGIRKITPAGVVTTLAGGGNPGSADGTGVAASFSEPAGLAVDADGNVYVADVINNEIRKVTPAGVVTTLAGSPTPGNSDGTGPAAGFSYPFGVTVDSVGNVYVADTGNNEIRKITPAGVVTTLAGSMTAGSANGAGIAATFDGPTGIAVDALGALYVVDSGNSQIRRIAPQ